MDKTIRWQIVRLPDGYAGKIIVPANGMMNPATGKPASAITVRGPKVLVPSMASKAAKGAAKSAALASAASLAGQLANNPVVQALLPPGVGPALKGITAIANNPKVRAFVREGGKAAFRFLMRKLG